MPDAEAGSATATAIAELGGAERIHLVGIGGTGMNSLATLLAAMGRKVSGSDATDTPMLGWLRQHGVDAQPGHAADRVERADLVLVSAAIEPDNVELLQAQARGIPMMSHAEALGALMDSRFGVAVAGTHGKSTTTALLSHLLVAGGMDPTLVGGAVALDLDASSRLGHGPHLVAEADEFFHRFLWLHPRVAIITSIESDHLDYFGAIEGVIDAFVRFVEGMQPDAIVFTSADDPVLSGLALPVARVTYGVSERADWRLLNYAPHPGGGATLTLRTTDGSTIVVRSRLSGRHNAANALAAVAVASHLGVSRDAIGTGLSSFSGTRRRFETRYAANGIWLVDDYAHHPTAVRATLQAARDVHGGPIRAVFEPHTLHRTASLLDQFASAFDDADEVIVTPIFQPKGRSVEPLSICSDDLVGRMRHANARSVVSFDEAETVVTTRTRPGDLVITLGAGSIGQLADRLAARFAAGP